MDDLPQALIEARIIAGMSQKELAARLGLKQQQIQRYEATDYASASLTRVCEVARSPRLEGQGQGVRRVERNAESYPHRNGDLWQRRYDRCYDL